MRSTYTDGFKEQAVQKALQRAPTVTLQAVADELGCGYSTLHRWVGDYGRRPDTPEPEASPMTRTPMTRTPSTEPLTTADKLDLVIACAGLDDEALGAHCRRHGVYPHQVAQWKAEFAGSALGSGATSRSSDTKPLKQEVKSLKRELRRKEKALAEAAALLVLQKKVRTLWIDDEDDSP